MDPSYFIEFVDSTDASLKDITAVYSSLSNNLDKCNKDISFYKAKLSNCEEDLNYCKSNLNTCKTELNNVNNVGQTPHISFLLIGAIFNLLTLSYVYSQILEFTSNDDSSTFTKIYYWFIFTLLVIFFIIFLYLLITSIKHLSL